MTTEGPRNLDLDCAEAAAAIADGKVDRGLIDNALGVLQEDGVYALFVYTLSRLKKGEGAATLLRSLNDLMKNVDIWKSCIKCPENSDNDDQAINRADKRAEVTASARALRSAVQQLDLDTLFLAKDLLQHTLVYARYHARAIAAAEGKGTSTS
ncbi:MAG: hypothetical protein HY683_04215 [Chloroflexi bacterium]|nr:hypothetical protein [Chloroflexota bacterium]